jgi:hypothetical protein
VSPIWLVPGPAPTKVAARQKQEDANVLRSTCFVVDHEGVRHGNKMTFPCCPTHPKSVPWCLMCAADVLRRNHSPDAFPVSDVILTAPRPRRMHKGLILVLEHGRAAPVRDKAPQTNTPETTDRRQGSGRKCCIRSNMHTPRSTNTE